MARLARRAIQFAKLTRNVKAKSGARFFGGVKRLKDFFAIYLAYPRAAIKYFYCGKRQVSLQAKLDTGPGQAGRLV